MEVYRAKLDGFNAVSITITVAKLLEAERRNAQRLSVK